jgi:8-oxo-dGTP pyrophosphatase MutT (NUDIX family)
MSKREEGVVIVVWRRTPAVRVLLLHRSQFGSEFDGDWAWTTPGGGREPGEDPAAAAARELFEETGLALDCEPVQSEIARDQPGIDVAVFAAEAPADAIVLLSEEHDRYEWVGSESLTRCLPAWVHELYHDVLRTVGLY